MQDAAKADTEMQGKRDPMPWAMAAIPLILTLGLNFVSTYLASQMPPVEKGVQHYRPAGGWEYLSKTQPAIWVSALAACGLLWIARRHFGKTDGGSFGLVDRNDAGRFATRAGIVLLLSLFLSVVRAVLLGFWPEVFASAWIEYGLIAAISLLMLWRPIGLGTHGGPDNQSAATEPRRMSGFREAGIRFTSDVVPSVGLAAVAVLGLGPLIRRLSHAGMPRIMAYPRAFQWSWDLVPMTFDRFVDAAILFGVLYPALRVGISKRFVPEILIAIALCADTPYHRWPLFMWAALAGAYGYRRSGSMIPAFVALACTIFLTPWIQLLGVGK